MKIWADYTWFKIENFDDLFKNVEISHSHLFIKTQKDFPIFWGNPI
jgi:hypothetical protein